MDGRRNAYKTFLEDPEEKEYLKCTGVDGRIIILKRILKKLGVRILTKDRIQR
jgi:hypothetical protein